MNIVPAIAAQSATYPLTTGRGVVTVECTLIDAPLANGMQRVALAPEFAVRYGHFAWVASSDLTLVK